MHPYQRYSLAFYLLFLMVGASRADTYSLMAAPLEPVRMQLRWHHQFQFAGYYAAKEKGFYRRAGFDVTLIAGSPDRQPLEEVLAGRAQYAEGNSEVLLARLKGRPLVAMAVIFQHSPSVLLTLASSNIKSPKDLLGKTIMTVGGEGDASFIAMLHSESVSMDQLSMVASSYNADDLIDGNADAFNAYLSNEPFYLQQRGIAYNILAPSDYGVDFYSDILFTSEREARRHPERVARFKQASLDGWKYALEHPEEIIALIHDQYSAQKPLAQLRFEAASVRQLIMPELIEIGHINEARFKDMAEVFVTQGMVANSEALEGFVFKHSGQFPAGMYKWLVTIVVFLGLALIASLMLAVFNRRLKLEVEYRKTAEHRLQKLTDTDALTGLFNRRAFNQRYSSEVQRSRRYGDEFCIISIDLDYFNRINDNHGHDAGRQLLLSVAKILQENTREADICGRVDGEKFILLLPKTTLADARYYAERLCVSIRAARVHLSAGVSVQVTASMGIACWLKEDRDEATIIKADKALCQAKALGRDQIVTWSQEIRAGEERHGYNQ